LAFFTSRLLPADKDASVFAAARSFDLEASPDFCPETMNSDNM